MTLGKSLAILFSVFLLTFSINIFAPKYQPPVEKENLQEMIKNLTYDENKPDLKNINRILDVIPFRVALSYKNNIITSNISKENDEKRKYEGEKIISSLNKNIDSKEFKLSFEDNSSESIKYLNMFLIPLLSGFFAGGVFFLLVNKAENNTELIETLEGDLERSENLISSYQAKETEFSRRIEKSFPPTLDESHKMIKNMIRDKENMIKSVDSSKLESDAAQKDLKEVKDELSSLEYKVKEQTMDINKLTLQLKQIEDMKEKHEGVLADLREANKKIKEFEKINVEELKEELKKLKIDIKEISQSKKNVESELATLSKIDFAKLESDNRNFQAEIASLENKLEKANEALGSATTVNYLKEKDEKETIKKELEEVNAKLASMMDSSNLSDVGKLQKDFFELEENNKKLIAEFEESKIKFKADIKMQEGRNNSLREEFKERSKELEETRLELEQHKNKLKEIEKKELADKDLLDKELIAKDNENQEPLV